MIMMSINRTYAWNIHPHNASTGVAFDTDLSPTMILASLMKTEIVNECLLTWRGYLRENQGMLNISLGDRNMRDPS